MKYTPDFTKNFWTIKDLMAYLQVSEPTIYKLIKNGELKVYKPMPQKSLFKKSEIEEWIEASLVKDETETADDFLYKDKLAEIEL